VEAIAAAKKAQQEMYGALLSTREELIDMLEKKLVAYKDLLIKEMVMWWVWLVINSGY
jgi:hypothetical protein